MGSREDLLFHQLCNNAKSYLFFFQEYEAHVCVCERERDWRRGVMESHLALGQVGT